VALVWPINYDTCVALVGSSNNNIFCSVLLLIYYIPAITINTLSKMKRKTTLSYYICKHVLRLRLKKIQYYVTQCDHT
jgi:hypothetical protein